MPVRHRWIPARLFAGPFFCRQLYIVHCLHRLCRRPLISRELSTPLPLSLICFGGSSPFSAPPLAPKRPGAARPSGQTFSAVCGANELNPKMGQFDPDMYSLGQKGCVFSSLSYLLNLLHDYIPCCTNNAVCKLVSYGFPTEAPACGVGWVGT